MYFGMIGVEFEFQGYFGVESILTQGGVFGCLSNGFMIREYFQVGCVFVVFEFEEFLKNLGFEREHIHGVH